MCGITGFFSPYSSNSDDFYLMNLKKMSERLFHRGPDDSGLWYDLNMGVGFAHRRLAIIDLSKEGHQPMISKSRRFSIVFNGEIYNHHKIRSLINAAIPNIKWRGSSDTETLLEAIETWGLEDTLKKSKGMFAFALWDSKEGTLSLCRDRMGEKPLYYSWQGSGVNSTFIFASELNAIKNHTSFDAQIDRKSLAHFTRYSCIGESNTIYENVFKLKPGHILSITEKCFKAEQQQWWSAIEVAKDSKTKPFYGSPNDAVDKLEFILDSVLQDQMNVDVPFGAFLSGGIDSSLIVASMQKLSESPINTFSIGFNEEQYNEANHAKEVAKHIGTNHTELYLSPSDIISIIPNLPNIYDEPFADSSQLPTFLISELTRKDVTVAFSGDAGDELFGGYTRYEMTAKLWKYISHLPKISRKIIHKLLIALPPDNLNKIFKFLPYSHIGSKIHKSANYLGSNSIYDLYQNIVSQWYEEVVCGVSDSKFIFEENFSEGLNFNDVEKMMLLDTIHYIPNDILTKVDRASMSVSLETRIPFLDHELFQFGWSLPLDFKIRNGKTKWLLRQLLNRHVPMKLIERPKMGFSIPIDVWLRGPLREWAEDLLDKTKLLNDGYFNQKIVKYKWDEHISGKRDWQNQLWSILMFQSWLENEKRL